MINSRDPLPKKCQVVEKIWMNSSNYVDCMVPLWDHNTRRVRNHHDRLPG